MNDTDNGDGKSDGAVAVYSAELGGTYGVVWKLGKVEAVRALHFVEKHVLHGGMLNPRLIINPTL